MRPCFLAQQFVTSLQRSVSDGTRQKKMFPERVLPNLAPKPVILREAPHRKLLAHKRLAPTEGPCLQNR